MKSNPEEFVGEGVYSKWSDLFSTYRDSLEPEDIQAFESARKALIQEQFTADVMKELLDPKSLEDVINQYRVKGMPSVGQTLASSLATSKAMSMGATLTANSNSLTLGNTTINESHLEHMKAHVEALQQEYVNVFNKPKRWWNKSIPELFGKK